MSDPEFSEFHGHERAMVSRQSSRRLCQAISRRAFLGMGVAAGAALASATIQGFVIEPRWLDVRRFVLPVDDLPAGLEGYKVAQITDLHLREMGRIHEAIFETLLAAGPDLLVLTGDIVESHDGLALLERFCHRLLESVPSDRIVATLGNWEHLTAGLPAAVGKVYERLGIELLVNGYRRIADDLVLVGVDDWTRGKPEVLRAIDGLPQARVRLLVTHSPALFDTWPKGAPTFDLGLAGHTHGGQVRFFSHAPVLPSGSGRFVSGFYDAPAGQVFISRGIGTSKMPVRFMCRPELPIFKLTATA